LTGAGKGIPCDPEAGSAARITKNISYRPQEDRLKGVDQNGDAEQRARVHEVMRAFSQRAIGFMERF